MSEVGWAILAMIAGGIGGLLGMLTLVGIKRLIRHSQNRERK